MKLFRSTILAVALCGSAILAQALPTMLVQGVETDKRDEYLALLAKGNERTKAIAGVEKLRHLWVGDIAANASRKLVVVSMYDSAAQLVDLQDKTSNDPEVKGLMKEFAAIRKLGATYLYKGVRFEGLYEGGAVLNTEIAVKDQDAYLKSLDGLKAIFDANGFKDAKLNCFRLAAGRDGAETHIVIICLPNVKRVAELIDLVNDTTVMKQWNADVAANRTVVGSGTWHEVTK